MTDTPKAKKPAAKAKAANAPVVEAPPVSKEVVPPASLKLKDFVDLVGAASGGNRRDVRKIVEATLTLLHERLQKDTVLVLPPLGRLRVVKDEAGLRTVKLREIAPGKGAKAAKEALAGGDD